MRILIVSDAWEPQVNGVVRTLQAMQRELTAMGHVVGMITPDLYRSLPCPTYPEIRLAMARPRSVGDRIAAFAPDAVHIATEGPLCLAARRWCLTQGMAFTTAYHTQFPDYVQRRTGIPAADRQHLTAAGAGHYGIFSGRRWRTQVYPKVKAFIAAHAGPPLPVAATKPAKRPAARKPARR